MRDKTKKGIVGIVGAVIAALAIANMGFQLKDNIDNHQPVEDNTDTNIEQPEEA